MSADSVQRPAPERIVLVDGYAHIYRCFHAIPDLKAPSGQPTNALYGMARLMLALERALPHRFGALVLDKGRPAHRLELWPQYKAERPPMPEALQCQLEPIRAWVEASGWPVLEADGFEADDLIAGVVAASPGYQIAILSHDKDLGQLVGPGVSLVQPGPKGVLTILDRDGIKARFGVFPEQLCDYLALVGDSVDNIPGVPGIGAKTAAALLARFGDIEGLFAHIGEVERPAVREALAASAELVRRNRALVRLRSDLPPAWKGLEGLRRRTPQWERLLAMAQGFGFRSLTSELEARLADARNPGLPL